MRLVNRVHENETGQSGKQCQTGQSGNSVRLVNRVPDWSIGYQTGPIGYQTGQTVNRYCHDREMPDRTRLILIYIILNIQEALLVRHLMSHSHKLVKTVIIVKFSILLFEASAENMHSVPDIQ